MNFQDIFENDKLIFLEQYKQLEKNKNIADNLKEKQPKYVIGTYQDALYNLLSEYFQYPSQIRMELRSLFALLVEIYDLAIKIDTSITDGDKNIVEKVEDETSIEFYQYLIEI